MIGRSQLVGRPLALMMVERNATVTIIHSKTRNPWEISREADVVVAAVGHANLVQSHWIKPGATV
ncbi:MAG TPA: bifunctional methylenetetrahydrofolate dehydrogenase/methenyltetrahydrofolate cyclohydrolase, partial [Sulfobacillus sp.]|nr:bifunctional methylenetetrahydrofolate dehydrogenase/methenyltetrahydrofolate cyclohydrolase [Sulfobacillus sp.]